MQNCICSNLLQQKAIARYYNEEPKPLDDKHHAYSPHGRKTEKLLSREFWRGQMHGSSAYGSNLRTGSGNASYQASYQAEDWIRRGGPIHARHMRSKCAIIPRGESLGYSKRCLPLTSSCSDAMPQNALYQGSSAPTLDEGRPASEGNSLPDRPLRRDKNVALFVSKPRPMVWRVEKMD